MTQALLVSTIIAICGSGPRYGYPPKTIEEANIFICYDELIQCGIKNDKVISLEEFKKKCLKK